MKERVEATWNYFCRNVHVHVCSYPQEGKKLKTIPGESWSILEKVFSPNRRDSSSPTHDTLHSQTFLEMCPIAFHVTPHMQIHGRKGGREGGREEGHHVQGEKENKRGNDDCMKSLHITTTLPMCKKHPSPAIQPWIIEWWHSTIERMHSTYNPC